jgi:GNAT superfamily N-acetyltransferase
MMAWAIDYAKSKGCHMVQLTTDKSRPQAKAFYEALGFTASHEGMKLHLRNG